MKKFCLMLAVSLTMLSAIPVQTFATETDSVVSDTISESEIELYSGGLISLYSLSCYPGEKKIYINARVIGFDTMAKIGFKNIKIEKSTNLVNWTTEKTISNDIAENTISKSWYDKPVSVQGGYYYRVTLTNYAKEQAILFPSSQSITSTSDSVWVS